MSAKCGWSVTDRKSLVPDHQIKAGDEIVVHMGNIIPFDGVVTKGEAMVNQASLTENPYRSARHLRALHMRNCSGRRRTDDPCKRGRGHSSRFEKIVTMIEESEK